MEIIKFNETRLQIKDIESKIENSISVDEIKNTITPKIAGIIAILKEAGLLSIEQENELYALKLKAEVKIGKLLDELDRKESNQYIKENEMQSDIVSESEYTKTLIDFDINDREARRLQEIKDVTLEEIDELKEEANKEGKKLLKKSLFEVAKKKKKKKKKIEKEISDRKELTTELDIRKGDFKEVLNDVYNIDCIITDPPYPKEFLDCFSDLGKYAKEHLKDKGFLVCYSGQYHLDEVIKRLSEHLSYVWTFCLYHKGKKQLVNGVNIMCGWKPVLIFSKSGNKKMRYSAYDVVVSEEMEKHSHEWQQSESGVEKLIEIFTAPGELVVDPFSGSGTFVKVAHEMKRNSIGAEIK